MSKFGGLAAHVDAPFRVVLLHPSTDEPIVDKKGQEAFVEVFSGSDSEKARAFDKEQRNRAQRRAMKARRAADVIDDHLEISVAKCARLTVGWYLVDPDSGEPIAFDCNEDNAAELYAAPETAWIYRQVLLGAADAGNFMKSSPKD